MVLNGCISSPFSSSTLLRFTDMVKHKVGRYLLEQVTKYRKGRKR